jgi:hypothetical protein
MSNPSEEINKKAEPFHRNQDDLMCNYNYALNEDFDYLEKSTSDQEKKETTKPTSEMQSFNSDQPC